VKAPDHRGQRQALDDERHEDHRERQKQDQVAIGERRSAVDGQGDRERGRKRHRAAHPDPAEHDRVRDRQPASERAETRDRHEQTTDQQTPLCPRRECA
jgi:hypothetical protein